MNAGKAPPAGVLLVDKPAGPSSFKMVHLVRRTLGVKKVGHTGTLDPFASGLLVVCVGRPATKIIGRLMDGDKTYEATLRLGVETDSHDLTGTVTAERPVRGVDEDRARACLARFSGRQKQAPPAFSAVKHKGKPLYHYARKGIRIEKAPREIVIHDIDFRGLAGNELTIRVRCGKGTYIRVLAHDIGRALGCGAHLLALRRTHNGPFSVDEAVDGERLAGRRIPRETLAAAMMSVEAALAAAGDGQGGPEAGPTHETCHSTPDATG